MHKFSLQTLALEKPGMYILQISGWVDLSSYTQVEIYAQSIMKSGKEVIVFDLNQLEYINSQGLGSWLSLQKQLEDKGGTIVLIGARERVKQTIEITGVNTIIPMYDTLADAQAQCEAMKA